MISNTFLLSMHLMHLMHTFCDDVRFIIHEDQSLADAKYHKIKRMHAKLVADIRALAKEGEEE